MGITLLASQCPLPVVETSYPLLSVALNTAGTGVAGAQTIASGTSVISAKWNQNADRIDLLATYGGGGFAICTGLTLSAGSGLTLNIAAGLAAIGTYAEKAASTLAVPDNHNTATDRVWIWLSQAGAISSTLTTTPPTTRCVCLGSVTTFGGVITGVDTSGVMYLRGGALWRETADLGPPTDSPIATLSFHAKTPGGIFEWDGSAYRAVYAPLSANKTTIASGEAVRITSTEQVIIYDSILIDGDLIIDGELVIL